VTSPGAARGILGGTFDPPHLGHVALAEAALDKLPIDELEIWVEEHPGHRGVVADPKTRLKMAHAAFPDLKVRLDPHPFTAEAVRGGEEALFVVGADQAADFHRWKDPEEVLKWVKLAVGTRGGIEMPDLSRWGDRVVPFELASPEISSSEVRERVAAGETIDDLVPPAVARLIEELELYR
jgi:nicotinate-nucleotide adenylyltransferase